MSTPLAPSTAYLERLAADTAERAARAAPLSSPYSGAAESMAVALTDSVLRRREALLALSHDIHAHPETAHSEHRAVAGIAKFLHGEGYNAQVGAYGLSTAVRASAGGDGDGPRVAVLAEYDALPGIGHACGHNVICASAVGAWLALAERIAELGGTVELIGTPAEEGGAGKEYIARGGGFEGLDAVVMLHPFSYDVAAHPFLGRRVVDVQFHGVAAHAAAMPFMGRNALDGVVASYTGVAALRQHLPPTDRVHGVITDGGARPNVVPATASAQFYVRSADTHTLIDLCRRMDSVFAGAATSTGTRAEVTWDPFPPYLPIRQNRVLADRWAVHMGHRGRRVLPDGIVPETLTGSTDLDNVSLRVPAMHPMLAVAPENVSLHTAEFAEWARSARADEGVVDGAVGLALTVADFLLDPEMRTGVREEFEANGGTIGVPNIFN